MIVNREMLMAYADGELDETNAQLVEKAISEDPGLARQLEEERALRMKLQAHFSPVVNEPVPDRWTAMIADTTQEEEKVVDLAKAREKRTMRGVPRWGAGVAIAASLVLGVMLGIQIGDGGPVAERHGTLVASAGLARALDTQLASDQEGTNLRMLASFRRAGGNYCRAFAGQAYSGIACREDEGWRLERLMPGSKADASQYRQAGSAEAELMAAAQQMAAGEPLDAEQEVAARSKGWR